MKERKLLFGALLAFGIACQGCGGGDQRHILYVSPSGDDGAPGTADHPFRTLERARDEIRAMKRDGPLPAGGMAVHLKEGEHIREAPFVLRPDDSGEDGAPVLYTCAPGERAVVTGGRRITGWATVMEPLKGMDPALTGRLSVATIPKGWKFHFLFVDGKPQQLSRLYNGHEWFRWPKPVRVGPAGDAGQPLEFRGGELEGLEGLDGQVEMDLLPVNYWNTLSVLKQIDPARSTAFRHSLNPTTFARDSFFQGNYNLLNALRFIDEPGEWAVDTVLGKVYLFPSDGPIRPEQEVIAPGLYRLVHVVGDSLRPVRHIHFRGIEFRYTDRMPEDIWPEEWVKRQAELPDGMIRVENAEKLVLSSNSFFWSGSYAVDLEKYAQNITVAQNEMGHMGCGGVLLQGYGPGLLDVNRKNTVSLNHIHHTGNGGYLHSAAVTVYQSGSNEIAFNLIHDIPYAGVQICGTNWDAFNADPGSNKMDPRDPGGIDSYGRARAQYRTRWEELPRGRDSRFTRESFKPYLHSSDNDVHHNIILEYLQVLSDGAPLYSWSSGMGNLYYHNLMKRKATAIEGQKWVFAIYMDDNVDGAVLYGNVVWSQTHPGVIFLNKGENMWSGNEHRFPEQPAGFDTLLKEIVREGMARGGWPGVLPPEVAQVVPKDHD